MEFKIQFCNCPFYLAEDGKEGKSRAGSSTRNKDRKSPNTVQNQPENQSNNDSDEDKKEPKVPPLKIVLSNNTNEVDTSVRCVTYPVKWTKQTFNW